MRFTNLKSFIRPNRPLRIPRPSTSPLTMDQNDGSAVERRLLSPAAHSEQHGDALRADIGAVPSPSHQDDYPPSHFLTRRDSNQSGGSGAKSATSSALYAIQHDLLASWLHTLSLEKQWTTKNAPNEAVFIKRGKKDYAQCPPEDEVCCSSLREAVAAMNVKVS